VHSKVACVLSDHDLCARLRGNITRGSERHSGAAVLNLWAAAHWWAADLCLVGRDQGWELRNFVDVSHVSQSVRSYQVLVVELEFPLYA